MSSCRVNSAYSAQNQQQKGTFLFKALVRPLAALLNNQLVDFNYYVSTPPYSNSVKKSTRFTLGAKVFIAVVVVSCIASAYALASVLKLGL